MADRKKNRRKFDEDEPPTKEDYAIAKFLRFNVPTRQGKLHSMEVHCFFASAAVDALMESKWSSSKNAKDPLFFNRSSCVNYCQRLMHKGMFHRAERVQRKKDKGEGKTKKKKSKEVTEKEDTGTGDELRERKGKKDKKGKKEKDETPPEKTKQSEKEGEEKKEEKKDEGKKKKEKRLKLVMTEDQRFLDGEENIYVWIYDPVNAKTLMIGTLIVLGAIALCLFPLWPEVVRVGVYYVSLAAAGFVGFILSLVVLRLILFCCIWLLTLGRHHFWLLPNLTEDVGFFESFRPLYKHDKVSKDSEASSKDKDKSSKSSSKKSESKSQAKTKKKDKSSDKEDSGSEQEEFEMIDRGDVEEEDEDEEDGGDRMEGEDDTEDNGDTREEEDYYDDEEDQNGAPEEEDEEEEEEEVEEGDLQSRKDK